MDPTRVAPLAAPFAADDLIQVAGLPLHPLVVHAVVVLTPLTVLALLLGTFWPQARRRLGIVTALGAALLLVLVPVTVLAGRSLAALLGPIPAVVRHQGFGEMLLPWAIALFVVAAGQWAWFRFAGERMQRNSPGTARVVRVVIAVAAVVVGVGTLVLIVLTGDSGARAVWGGLTG